MRPKVITGSPLHENVTKACRSLCSFLSGAVRWLLAVTCLFFIEYSGADSAWAVQSHGGAEGLVSHQIGHFLFVVGLVYLIYRIHSMRMHGQGWGAFKIFLWLLVLWNLVTFSGHWMDELISREKFIKANGTTLSFVADNIFDVIFYLTRLDHLLLVPSFVFLLLALRKWRTLQ